MGGGGGVGGGWGGDSFHICYPQMFRRALLGSSGPGQIYAWTSGSP